MTYMELVDIVSTLLIFGSGLLLVVVVISFLLSKAREEENLDRRHSNKLHNRSKPSKQNLNYEQQMMRDKQFTPSPKVFQLDQFKPKEANRIRKISSSERLSDERYYAQKKDKTNTKTTRYTIVNDTAKKQPNKVMNFYL